MRLSAVILTKNEEKNIRECIKCLSFCDEILVVDDESEDKTRDIAGGLGARVFVRPLDGNFSSQRNYAIGLAQGKWVVFVDPDERVSKELAGEIIRVINDPAMHYDGFYLKRHDFLWGRCLTHGEIGGVRLLRLAKKKAGRWRRRVHEVWDILGPTYELNSPLLHYPHQSLEEFLGDINYMSTLDARAKDEEGRQASLTRIIFWPSGKFIYNFVFRLGFLDGLQGFIVALIMSFHSFLSWSKLWKMQEKA